MNSEFYPGWINHWSYPRNTVATEAVVNTTKTLISLGANFNVYMMHGGTSFGYMAGSIMSDTFQACVTSYDFNAPITENGNTTDKLLALRELIYPYTNMTRMEIPDPLPVTAYGDVPMKWQTSFLEAVEALDVTQVSDSPVVPFCEVHQAYGFVAYSALVTWQPVQPAVLAVPGVRDRGYVWLDDRPAGVLSRADGALSLPLLAESGSRITIVVESLGRICYGDIYDRKGLLDIVTLGGRELTGWNISVIPQNLTEMLPATPLPQGDAHHPALYSGMFTAPEPPTDSFLHFPGWHKGVAFVNGVNLGRYWPAVGPQMSLFVPAPFLRAGTNDVTLLELDGAPCGGAEQQCVVSLRDYHVLDGPTPDRDVEVEG